jgi:hypothetical protein
MGAARGKRRRITGEGDISMKSFVRSALAASAMLCGLALSASPAAAQSMATPPDPAANPCQRACLEGWVNKYLEAMKAHKVDPALFARDVKFTENGIHLPLGGEGLWFDMTDIGSYKFYVPDVETQQVAFIGTVKIAGRASTSGPAKPTTVGLDLRLKIRNDRIVEVEQLAIRPEQPLGGAAPAPSRFPPAGEAVEALGAPHPIFAEVIPPAERMSREKLIETANYYFTGMAPNDGKGYYPFTDDCLRRENGMISAGPKDAAAPQRQGCKEQFEKSLKGVVSRIRDRRFVAVDRERGIVYAFAFFDHHNINWTWQLAELFKIEKGKIRRIEALFQRAPFGTPSGWSTYEQAMSEEIQDVR